MRFRCSLIAEEVKILNSAKQTKTYSCYICKLSGYDITVYCCIYCSYGSTDMYLFERHARTHSKYCMLCKVCKYECYSSDAYRLHMSRHFSASGFRCAEDSCQKIFKHIDHLQEHIKAEHVDLKERICPHCK